MTPSLRPAFVAAVAGLATWALSFGTAAVAAPPEGAPPAAPAADAPAALPLVGTPPALIGFSDRPFIRTPGDEVILFPSARLQVDAAAFPRQSPKSGAYLRRARVGLSGWLTRTFYFDVGADVAPGPDAAEAWSVPPSQLPASDNYLAYAPLGDRLIVQAGQFDAPFTLENRTLDPYTDFIERSMAVRSLGVPRNKEVGAMVHGLIGGGVFYYSGGVFNGEGPGFRSLDNQPDAIGRLVLAPFAARDGMLRQASIGASGWYGRHVVGPMFPVQATPGGVRFLAPRWVTGQGPGRSMELREHGDLVAAAGELNLPIGTRFGMRAEVVWKRQELAEADVTLPGPPVLAGKAELTGFGSYGELWVWLVGSDRQLPAPGRQLPGRPIPTAPGDRRVFEDGLMFAVRGEFLKEDVTTNAPTLGNPTRATTRVISGTAALNYWRGPLARFSIDYVVNAWSGTSETIKLLRVGGQLQHELLLRFGMSF